MFCSLEIELNLYFVFAYLSFTVKCCWHFCDNGSLPRGLCANTRASFFAFSISSGHPNVNCAAFCLFFFFFSSLPFIHLSSMPLRLPDSSVVQCSFNSLLASWLTAHGQTRRYRMDAFHFNIQTVDVVTVATAFTTFFISQWKKYAPAYRSSSLAMAASSSENAFLKNKIEKN